MTSWLILHANIWCMLSKGDSRNLVWGQFLYHSRILLCLVSSYSLMHAAKIVGRKKDNASLFNRVFITFGFSQRWAISKINFWGGFEGHTPLDPPVMLTIEFGGTSQLSSQSFDDFDELAGVDFCPVPFLMTYFKCIYITLCDLMIEYYLKLTTSVSWNILVI